MEQLSPCATTAALEPMPCNKKAIAEKPVHCRLEGNPQALQLEKHRVQQQRPSTAKNKT